ncbi:MAG: 3-hydroxyacyl-ACP dehydratase FabZ [Deltaproteobacteria bacterium]|nr:3-hydroxyacyl-ACP dehydratase FabZ [Deltaproteobacteria bacterium]
MDIKEILATLPHRYPFILVDRVVELDLGKGIKAIKNVTINEPFFMGHFPGHPVMPCVLIIEAMAQVAALLAFKSGDVKNSLVYFMGIDKARFRKPVIPGDVLVFTVSAIKVRGPVWVLKAEAHVDNGLVAEAEIMATIVEKTKDE